MEIDFWKPLAGLMLFLLAMSLIEESIRAIAGNKVKAFIGNSTRSPLRGIVSGTCATALLQSSSLVGLLVLAFVGARIMKLKDALLIIFGANLGTTATGWIVATIGFKLDLEVASLPLMAIGGLFWIVGGASRTSSYGRLGLGIGLLLMALEFMKSALGGAESVIEPEFLAQFSLIEYLLFGLLFSALVQSSSAVMVVTLSALSSGIVELHAAAALMIGADLGTTTTIIFGAIRGSANKKRVALGHVLFNLGTDLLAFILLLPLVALVSGLSDPLLALVAFHSLFNLLGVCLYTPLVGRFADFLNTTFVDDTQIGSYLDPSTQVIPETAAAALLSEISVLTQQVIEQNSRLFAVAGLLPSQADYEESYQRSKKSEGGIIEYALDLDLLHFPSEVREKVEKSLQISRNLLLSAKLCKDSLHNLHELADIHAPLCREIVQVQQAFYAQFQEIGDDFSTLQIQQIEAFAQLTVENHDHLHERIYAEIQSDRLPASNVSSVLNINRGLYNSNVALLTAIASYNRVTGTL